MSARNFDLCGIDTESVVYYCIVLLAMLAGDIVWYILYQGSS